MADLEKTAKTWGSGCCQVVETITKTAKTFEKRSNGGWGNARLTFVGASLDGKAYADAHLFTATGAASVNGSGRETHLFKMKMCDGCTCESAFITLRCRASGGISGFLKDTDMDASAVLSVNVCGDVLPLELQLNPKLDESEQTTEVSLNLKGSQESTAGGSLTAPAAGGATAGAEASQTSSASGGGTFKVTWKKIRGTSGAVALPAMSKEETGDCCGRVFSIESVTSGSISARNNDNTGDDCRIKVDIQNEIETLDVTTQCSCDEAHQQTSDSTNPPSGVSDEQKQIIDKWIRELGDLLHRLSRRLQNASMPDSVHRAAIRQYMELLRFATSANEIDQLVEERPIWATSGEAASMDLVRLRHVVEESEHELAGLQLIAAHLADGWHVVGAGMKELRTGVDNVIALAGALDGDC